MDDEVEEEGEEDFEGIPALRFDRDAIASVMLEYAADVAEAQAKMLTSVSFLYASQFKQSVEETELHEAVTRDIESLPDTEQ